MKKLTIKQKRFCEYYLETLGNGTEAVIKAVYEVKRIHGKVNKNLASSKLSIVQIYSLGSSNFEL